MSDVILIDKLLLDAIDLIRKNKWGQDGEIREAGVYCLITAIHHVADWDYPFGSSFKATRRLGFNHPQEAFDWNDVPGRTVEEVIARLQSGVRADITPE
jgi:hypothetical protein